MIIHLERDGVEDKLQNCLKSKIIEEGFACKLG